MVLGLIKRPYSEPHGFSLCRWMTMFRSLFASQKSTSLTDNHQSGWSINSIDFGFFTRRLGAKPQKTSGWGRFGVPAGNRTRTDYECTPRNMPFFFSPQWTTGSGVRGHGRVWLQGRLGMPHTLLSRIISTKHTNVMWCSKIHQHVHSPTTRGGHRLVVSPMRVSQTADTGLTPGTNKVCILSTPAV